VRPANSSIRIRPGVNGSPALKLKLAKEDLTADAANETRDIMETFLSNSRNLAASYHIYRGGHGILNPLGNFEHNGAVCDWRGA
jgi:hypothetical protein